MKKTFIFAMLFLVLLVISLCHAEEGGTDDELKMKVFTVQHGSAASLSPVVEQMKSARGRVSVHTGSNNIIVYDYPEVLARIEKIITQLDAPQKQVDIKALVTETSGIFLKKAGITLTRPVISSERFNEIRYLISNDTHTNIRSEMMVKTLSGSPATLRVAREEIYPGTVTHTGNIMVVSPTIERAAGNFLDVLPKVNNDGTITVKILPAVSEFIDKHSTRERSVLTQAVVRNGDTIVLGGIGTESQHTVQDEIPSTGLSAARGTDESRRTVMFLTVTIVE